MSSNISQLQASTALLSLAGFFLGRYFEQQRSTRKQAWILQSVLATLSTR